MLEGIGPNGAGLSSHLILGASVEAREIGDGATNPSISLPACRFEPERHLRLDVSPARDSPLVFLLKLELVTRELCVLPVAQ